MLDTLALGIEPDASVGPIHRAVERQMRPTQVRRYQVRVVEIGQRRVPDGSCAHWHRLAERCPSTGPSPRAASGRCCR